MDKTIWKILLIDEDEDDCLLTRDMLNESQGRQIEMDWAQSFETGVETLAETHYDAVLVDYDLKPHNGVHLIRQFTEAAYPAPFILYSGQALYETELEALQAGATAYLSKREVTPLLLERLIRYAIERKQAEAELKESEQSQRALAEKLASDQSKLSAVLNNLPVGIWIADSEGRLIGKNEQADRIWAGETPLVESMQQYQEYAAWWVDTHARVLPEEYPVARAARTGQPVEPVEMRIRRFDGTEGYVLVSAAPIKDQEGRLEGVVGVNLDITDRRAAEAALQKVHAEAEEGRRLLEALLEHVPEGISITSGPPDFRITHVSRWASRVSGRSSSELLNHSAGYHQEAWGLKLADGETVPATEQLPLYRAGHYGQQTSNMEMVVEAKDGSKFPILVRAAPIRDEQGQIVGAINCWMDISERKQAEALAALKVAEAEASAREAELRRSEMDALFEQINEAVLLCDLEGVPQKVNPRVVETYGFDPTGMPPAEIAMRVKTTDQNGNPRQLEGYLTEMALLGDVVRSHTLRIVNPGGDRYSVSASANPFYNTSGEIAGIIITWHDITEREEQAQVLRESEQRYSALFNAKTNGIAHCRVITDAQGQPIDYEIIQVNSAYEEITGIKRKDIEGRRAREVFPGIENFAYDYIGNYGRVGLKGEELNIEVYFETLRQWLSIYVYSPKPGEFIAIFTDVSVRKETEQSLRESEERFRLARQAVDGIVYDWEPARHSVRQMDGIYQILGLPVDEPLPSDPEWWQKRIHPEDAPAARKQLEDALAGKGDGIDCEYRIQHHQGNWIHLWDRAFILHDNEGNPARVVGFAVDITERKAAEARADFLQQLGRDLNAARRSEEVGAIVVERLCQFLDVDRCLIAEPNLAERTVQVCYDYQRPGLHQENIRALSWNIAAITQELQEDEVIVVEDVSSHPLTAGIISQYLAKVKAQAFVLVPLAIQEERLVVLAVACCQPHRWNKQDVHLIRQAARQAWLTIERAEVIERLRESEERFRVALDQAPISVFTQDRDLRFTWVYNPLGGFLVEDLEGYLESELIPPGHMEGVMELKREVIELGLPRQKELHVRVGDSWMDVILNARPVFNAEGQVSGLIGAVMDISAVRQLQAQQIENEAKVQVQRWLMEHREKERMQIARTLHDKPLQDLLAVHLYLNNIFESSTESLPGNFTQAQQILEKAIDEVRSLALDLRPPMLMHMGLEKAMRAYVASFRQRNPDLLVQLDLEQDQQTLSEDTRLALYRIFQELLQNVSEHAGAGEAWISLHFTAEEVVLVVKDDGSGFETPARWVDLASTGHLGLVGISERMEFLNGTFEIDSNPGSGTQVEVRVPISQNQSA
jgi:PAS domain S-box-containing protein